MYSGIYNCPDGYFGYKTEKTLHDCGRGFSIERISECVEDGEYSFTLRTFYGEAWKYAEFPRGHMDKKYIGELAGKGFDVNPNNFDVFLKALQNAEEEYLRTKYLFYINKDIGWQYVYIDGKERRLYKSHGRIGNYPSEYTGPLDIEPRGSLQGQLDMIRTEVEGNIPLEAVLAIGTSAILNGLIGESVNVSTLLVHLYGDSTQGKTTAAQLAVSIAGSCDVRKSGLFMSWNGTYNSIVTRLRGNKGMPVAFDEISKYKGNDLSSIVYALTDGREKDRCNKDGNIKAVGEFDCWQTTIISTGEASLLSKCNNNTGLKVRVLELDDIFTSSAQNADNIKNSIREHCGNIAPKLASKLSNMNPEDILTLHERFKNRFIKKCGDIKQVDRIANNIAMFILAAHVLNKAFSLHLHVGEILSYFADNVKKNSENRDIADVALEKILEVVNINKAKFAKDSYVCEGEEIQAKGNECLGKICQYKGNNPDIAEQVVIYYDRFCQIVHDVGFEDEKVVIGKMKEKGYLDCEKGKNYRKRKVNANDAVASKVIVINVPKDISEVTEEEAVLEQSVDDTSSSPVKEKLKSSFEIYLESHDEDDGVVIFDDDCDEDDDRELKDVG